MRYREVEQIGGQIQNMGGRGGGSGGRSAWEEEEGFSFALC